MKFHRRLPDLSVQIIHQEMPGSAVHIRTSLRVRYAGDPPDSSFSSPSYSLPSHPGEELPVVCFAGVPTCLRSLEVVAAGVHAELLLAVLVTALKGRYLNAVWQQVVLPLELLIQVLASVENCYK